MKLVIEIPEKTNAHIRSDYGHGTKGLRDEDREILCDAIYHGTPYEDRPHGEWVKDFNMDKATVCSECGEEAWYKEYCGWVTKSNFCPNCGADMRKKDGGEK